MRSELNVLTAKDLQTILGIGKNRAYELMNSSCFPTMKINSRMYVTESALAEWLKKYSGTTYRI